MELDKIISGDSAVVLQSFPSDYIDLTVTSPPYDNLRTYNGFTFDFETIARELFRVTKAGGVVVWVVGDATIKGSETLTSFRQALYFQSIGFNVHDTMIWRKTNPTPTDPRIGRYTQSFEYMFVFSKGKPVHNLQRTPCKMAGQVVNSITASQLKKDGSVRSDRVSKRKDVPVQDTKIFDNVWDIAVRSKNLGHPAAFPELIAERNILSWSNEGDTVLDCFCGSGTTPKMAKLLNRHYIGIDTSAEYVALANERLAQVERGLTSRAADECQTAPDGKHSFLNDEIGKICVMCGTRR